MNIQSLKRTLVALPLAMTIFLTACGGGDDGGGNGGNSTPPPNPPAQPGAVAPAALSGRSYELQPSGGGQSSAITFETGAAYRFQDETGAIETGGYIANASGNAWTVTLQTGNPPVYNFTFVTDATGSYTRQRQGENMTSGNFTARGTPVPSGTDTTGGDTTGNPPDPTTGNPPDPTTGDPGTTTGVTPSPDYTGFSPVSIAGRTMLGTRTFTSTGPVGQTHTYTFSAGTFHDSDAPEESGGTFAYSANNSSATLNLTYTTPADFVGDRHNMTLAFPSKDRGTFQSTYIRGDGTTIIINGDFQIEPIP